MGALELALWLPLILLNSIGGIVGAAWLCLLGEWKVVGLGIVALLIGAPVISVLLLPGMAFVVPGVWLAGRGVIGKIASIPFAIASLLWTHALMALWCLFSIALTIDHTQNDALWPALLWGYAVGNAPWAFLAQKDMQSGNGNAGISSLFLNIGGSGTIALTGFFDFSFYISGVAVYAMLGIAIIIHLLFAVGELFMKPVGFCVVVDD